MVAALAFVSCTSTALDPLTGVFPDAQEPVLTTLNSSSFEKTATNRIFSLSFSGNGGAMVEVKLVGPRAQYYLESNVYGPGESAGCFLVGPTTINGKTVKSGNITVQKKAGDLYKLIFVLFDADGTPYRTKWEGDIVYEPDPEPMVLTKLLIAQANANNTVTFKLGTDDMGLDMMGTPEGNGYALTADVYSADGYLHEGVYTPAADHDNVGPFQYAPGYEYDLSEWGMGIMHWGTCWWEWPTVSHIDKEPITVEVKGSKFIITWGSEETYPHWATFTGEIPALTPSAVPTPDYSYTDEVSDAVDESYAPVAGVKTHNLTLRNKAGEEVAWFQLVLPEGETSYDGDYLCKEYAHEAYTFGNGYDLRPWGMDYVGGTRYMKNGELVLVNVGESISVFQLGDDVWEVIGNGFDFIFGTGGGSDFDGTTLTQFLGSADYTGYGINLAGVDLGTDGITVTAGAWGNTYGGDGNYLKLEFYSTDGKLAPGEYTACAVGGTVGEGEFGIGYDGAWGASGTTWYTMAAGTATGQYVTDGTLSVTLEGNVYTITLTSSTINAQYVGTLYE